MKSLSFMQIIEVSFTTHALGVRMRPYKECSDYLDATVSFSNDHTKVTDILIHADLQKYNSVEFEEIDGLRTIILNEDWLIEEFALIDAISIEIVL